MRCAVCGSAMAGPRHGHYFHCTGCGFRASDLSPSLASGQAHAALDEAARLEGLRALRLRNFGRVLDALEPLRAGGGRRLLDVGSGHGWFLQAAAARGWSVLGLEPDVAVAAHTPKGLPVVHGLFPDALPADAAFDVITFHDVFEHLPDPPGVLRECRRRLAPDGLLAIALPSSHGLLFRVASLLAAFGVTGPLHRFWQRGFPSPHLSYFHPDALAAMASRAGFAEVARQELPALQWPGLWRRIRLDRRTPVPVAALQFAVLAVLVPVLQLAPSDGTAQVFRLQRGAERQSAP